ncbi:CRISPR-associated helicase Cas3' [Protofrankia symbiont of Coriaria ruscifolia]|uniref:CRISPR-associated helicase Cas3' n=1 Tax=Protofrankia symbiont of Coriaria ruscifolia TaxID=1306542 RepID=UPI001F5E5F82|nr:CRISPR-associated helicase Cas3' [Protofrankia symbiont of Coriaria ruscifolia]
MGGQRTSVEALRVELFVPVASFRDPMFPGVTRCLPVPALSTVRGMLAAATGRPDEPVRLGMAASAAGDGVDLETYHPIAADGSNPAVGGRVGPGKGGATVRERPFLTGVGVILWIPGADGRRIEAALRRPVWGLRLGRSQDLVHLRGRPRWTVLHPTAEAVVGHALAPPDGHTAPQAVSVRLAEIISTDRLRTMYGSYLWCPAPAGRQSVHGAYRDEGTGEAVWLHGPDSPDSANSANRADRADRVDRARGHGELDQVLAKSATGSALGRPEPLTAHSAAVRDAARMVAERIGPAGPIAAEPRFWTWVEQAALLHDAGKVAAGFQRQLRVRKAPWGERHEVFSLAYVDLLTAGQPDHDRLMTATGVAFHHRPLTVSGGLGGGLADSYPYDGGWERRFGRNPDALADEPRVQVTPARHSELLAWFTGQLAAALPQPDGRRLWQRARDLFAATRDAWIDPVSPDAGLLAVLLQGAVTLADHCGSAHVPLQRHMPLPRRFLDRLATPYDHQRCAAAVDGHLILIAPTGSGKTEAGLAWASTQLATMPGGPRLVWVLPYRASIDAAVDRFTRDLDPPPGQVTPDIGVLHSTAARTLLTRAVAEDCAPGVDDARKARARAGAMRLFAQRVRVATPHQLLRAAIAGPRYSSVLLEQANAMFVLDELHAYDPVTFGRICAALRLWEQLGSRVAVLSATLAPPMVKLVCDSLELPVMVVPAAAGTAPDRHRLVLDNEPITAPASLAAITDWLAEGRSVLVVANTVGTAQQLYASLASVARGLLGDDGNAALLLHSRFKARDRARIEQRITARHPERKAGQSAFRGGGLVVSTQALEVSLCLDFDRGASELAPIEAVAQRAGRVNRRGRHPDGPVEFRVHAVSSHLPYEEEALDAAWAAMRRTVLRDPRISERTIDTWLADVYATPWGQQWARTARDARDEFITGFLTFCKPFEDRSEFADGLDKGFDTVHVLHADDVEEYQELSDKRDGDPLLAEGLLIPLSFGQYAGLLGRKCVQFLRDPRNSALRLPVVDVPYTPDTGLELARGQDADPGGHSAVPADTVL